MDETKPKVIGPSDGAAGFLGSMGVRFLIDGADIETYAGYVRIVVIFDGRDEEALALARAQWQRARTQGSKATYWRQTDAGRWEQKA